MRVSFQRCLRSAKRDFGRLRRCIVTAVTVSLFVLGPTGNASAASSAKIDPAGFVTTVGEQVVEVLDAQGLEPDQRLRHFRDIFVHALDLDAVARRVLGRHWRTTTDAQRERYVTLFRQYVVSMYAVQLGGYAGATFTVLRQQNLRENESLVIARFTHESEPPLGMNVLVRQMNGHFKIIDVTIAGISLVVTKRSEFDAVIRREGMPGLLRRLDEKQATMLRRQQEFIPLIAEAMRAMQGGTNVFFSN
jgi:phospholipid transport system substrate-binding protein